MSHLVIISLAGKCQKKHKVAMNMDFGQVMKILVATILAIIMNISYGQVDSTYKIDKELQNCLDSSESSTTIGMTGCMYKATEKWDAELNITYKELMNLLTDLQKEKLRIAQRLWIEYRDKEIEFSRQLYSDLEGTMWLIVAAQTKLDLTRERTIELNDYISNLTTER